MSYLGEKPAQTLAAPTSQYFNGTGSATVFTLNRAVNVAEDLDVFVNNVRQEPGVGKSYTATGTTLTFDAPPSLGTANVYVVYRGLAEVTTRLEHDANAALSATTGTFSGAFTSPGIDDNATSTAMTLDASGNVSLTGDFSASGHASIGASITDSTRALSIAGSTSDTLARALVCYNSLLNNELISIRNDGYISGASAGFYPSGGVYLGGTGSANHLDDYEFGFYSPEYLGGGNNGTQVYSVQTGVYTKIGNLVKVWIDITITSSSGMTGIPYLSLPFTSATSGQLGTDVTGSTRYEMGSWTPWACSTNFINQPSTGWISHGSGYMAMYGTASTSYPSGGSWNINTTGRISGTIWYTTA